MIKSMLKSVRSSDLIWGGGLPEAIQGSSAGRPSPTTTRGCSSVIRGALMPSCSGGKLENYHEIIIFHKIQHLWLLYQACPKCPKVAKWKIIHLFLPNYILLCLIDFGHEKQIRKVRTRRILPRKKRFILRGFLRKWCNNIFKWRFHNINDFLISPTNFLVYIFC